MKYNEFIRLKLKELREEKKLTQNEFSERIGMNQSQYARYERGKRVPKNELLDKIIIEFGVSDDYFDIPNTKESVSKKYVEQIERELAYFKNLVLSAPEKFSNFLQSSIKKEVFFHEMLDTTLVR